jgi:uncharacterized protein YrzB (UPF0473 family)
MRKAVFPHAKKMRCETMDMDQDVDIVVFEDENGNEVEFEVQFTFEHKGETYAVLTEATNEEPVDEEAPDMFILKVVTNGEEEEFIAVDENMMDELIEVVEKIFEEEMEDDDEE